jgi:transcriptional regulator with XRE-family HTH domain
MIPKAKCVKKGMGKRLKEWRKDQGLTLNQLSAKIDATPGPLSEAENGKSMPSVETLASLHRNTNINIMWLLFEDGKMLKKK